MSGFLFPSAASVITGEPIHQPDNYPSFPVQPTSWKSVNEDSENDSNEERNSNEKRDSNEERNSYKKIDSNEEKYSNDEWIYKSDDESKDHKKKKKKKKHSKKKKSKDKKQEQEIIKKPNTIWLESTKLQVEEAFRNDRRGDSCNWEFGELYKYDIAQHTPNRFCVGINNRLFAIKKRKKEDTVRYFKTKKLTNLIDNELDTIFNKLPEFSQLNNITHVKPRDNKSVSGESMFTNKNVYFSESLAKDPHSIKTWREYVDHQDSLRFDSSAEETFATPKAIHEKKLTILEKAISLNPMSVDLIVLHAQLAKESWSAQKLAEHWKGLVFRFANSVRVWQEYLFYVQSDLLNVKISKVNKEYRKCITTLIGVLNGTIRSHRPNVDTLDGLLMLIVQYVAVLWQAGYSENSTCILQCLIDYNLTSSNKKEEVKLQMFQQFFQQRYVTCDPLRTSGISYLQPNTLRNLDFETTVSECRNNSTTGQLHKWLHLERTRSALEVTAYHGDVDDCVDTDRVMSFDHVLFSLFTISSSDLVFQLLVSYLFLLGVPVKRQWLKFHSVFEKLFDVQTTQSCLCHIDLFSSHVFIDSVLNLRKSPVEEVIDLIRRLLNKYIGLFATNEDLLSKLSTIWLHFESVILHKRLNGNKIEKNEFKELTKFIKTLLKLSPNRGCIELWTMYASIEWNLVNVEKSQIIFLTAVQLTQGKKMAVFHCSTVVRKLLELRMEIRNLVISTEKDILQIFVAFTQPEKMFEDTPAGLVLLRTSTLLDTIYTQVLTELKNSPVALLKTPISLISDFLCCYVVFRYFYTMRRLHAVETILGDLFQLAESTLQHLEEVFVYILLLFKIEAKTNMAQYKCVVAQCRQMYGSREVFNRFYVDVNKQGMDSLSARRHYEEVIKSSPEDQQVWRNAIEYELQRIQTFTCEGATTPWLGVHNRVCSLFGRMVQQQSTMYCAGVWCKYINFLIDAQKEKQARDVFYLALRHCPTVKALYTLAIENFEKSEKIFELLEEKEIRVKVIMEEVELLLDENS